MTTVSVKNEAELLSAIRAVREDASPIDWVVAGHTSSPTEIQLVASGSGGLEAMKQALQDDNVCFGLVRFEEMVEMIKTTKFVYVHWEGPGMGFVKKGRYAIVRGDITDRYFSPAHVDIVGLTDRDDLTGKDLQTKGNIDRVLESTEGRQERTFTGIAKSVQAKGSYKTQLSGDHQVANNAAANGDVKFDSELKQTIADIRKDDHETKWVVAAYSGNDARKPVVVVAKGTGGVDEMASKLDGSMVMYAFARVQDVYEGIKTVKFVYLQWIGPEVGAMLKARTSVHKGAVHSVFQPFHVSMEGVCEVSEITEENVANKVGLASGSMNFVKAVSGSS
ncbi:hypothetical protein SARC_07724 [Sphaeroforma arctica JP610]|uniref:ADF-H domain-containing protein n=1 Tax=Sphaeroforma arctica JP610 TaxID=667725 RepID=A0A0L0FSY7_9EUKA|nr:hypothetical protein SARC_07724 [Sphaeroforma arctica JP610]KNC79905.1 hypothetical protein SARC_07724 [Sphaeroforma arctica JP610]|eukprot:XP_014153807.1 hypothetical protein SARC_07724 [Sphaeroforma arctica JP610]